VNRRNPVNMTLEPIGVVNNEFERKPVGGWQEVVSQVVIDDRWTPALEGLEGFSHIIVLFWLNRVREGVLLHVHPQGRQDMPAVGLFATRTPMRPNPIGLRVVRLVSKEANVLNVRGLDAFNGSPVLDIKPYLPQGDCVTLTRIPAWLERLWEEDG